MTILPETGQRKAAIFLYAINLAALLLVTGQFDREGAGVFSAVLAALMGLWTAGNVGEHWARRPWTPSP